MPARRTISSVQQILQIIYKNATVIIQQHCNVKNVPRCMEAVQFCFVKNARIYWKDFI